MLRDWPKTAASQSWSRDVSLLCGAGTPGPPHSNLCFLIKVRIYSGILLNHKKNQIMSSEAVWMDLEIIVLSQTETNII